VLKIQDFDGGIRCIGLDRAAKRNAINVELTFALRDALLQTRWDPDVSIVIFHGIGGHFSAGMDMKDFFDSSTRPPQMLQQARAATEHWRVWLLREMPQTLICAVQGFCLGSALPIVAASQVVLASQDARFGLPEINFALVPGAQIVKSASSRMTARGLSHAALTGRLFDAEQAKRWGLVTDVVDGDPLDAALALARRMAVQRGATR